MTINNANVQADASSRPIATSDSMRSQNMVVYTIGLADVDENFLYRVSNDVRSSAYDSSKLVGETYVAPTADQLQEIFEKLAAKILLRLTQ